MAYSGFQDSYVNQLPLVLPFGDSTTYGVGAQTLAAWREPVYNAAKAAATPIYFTGSQTNAGTNGGMTADPWCAGYPGATAETIAGNVPGQMRGVGWTPPDIVIWLAGTNSLDPGIGNESPATVAAAISSALDVIWSNHATPTMQIVLCEIFQRLDGVQTNVAATNALLPAVASGKSYAGNITLCSTGSAVPNSGTYYADTVHFNDLGYTTAAAVIWATVKSVRPRVMR